MKTKNTLGIVIGSILAATSAGAFAQGQGAVEVEAFAKHYFPDSSRDLDEGDLYGAGVSYFLTDDVSLGLSYGSYHNIHTDVPVNGSEKKIHGDWASLDAVYHFGEPGRGLRPYLSAGVAHQSIGQVSSGRNSSTYANIGAGVKWYLTEHLFAKAGLEGMHNIDDDNSEWMAGVGVGLNFGGGSRQVAQVEPTPAPAPIVDTEPEPAPETVRVELDVKFAFDQSRVPEASYADIRDLADFMQQYPRTTTVVEGYTDNIGTEQYNQRLSERRAEAVRNVLVDQYGVESQRVGAVGYGESNPIADNDTPEGRALNRRVEAEVEAQIR